VEKVVKVPVVKVLENNKKKLIFLPQIVEKVVEVPVVKVLEKPVVVEKVVVVERTVEVPVDRYRMC